MAHPFERIFDDALAESRDGDNKLTGAVNTLIDKGYSEEEVFGALKHFSRGLLDDSDVYTVREALESMDTSPRSDV
jgi:hypothetical protein